MIVLCCRGPLGTGMEEIYQITSALKYLSWGREVAVVTDARFSGVSTGACIGHVGPEALAGGPIGKVRDGDRIRVIVDRNQLVGSVDLVGDAERRVRRRSRNATARRSVRRETTWSPTPHCPTTRVCGPPCKPPAAAPGAAASTTSTASSSGCKAPSK